MKRLLLLIVLPVLLTGCRNGEGSSPESALYKRYASRADMTVAQVCDFRICDTVGVDVVLLQADDGEAWRRMVKEFGILDTAGVSSWLGDMENPAVRVKWEGRPVLRVTASHDRRTIGFYRLDTEIQYDAMLDYQLNSIRLNENKKNN